MLVALSDLAAYQISRGLSQGELNALADFNNSGTVTNADLQPLLSLIAAQAGNGELAAVPEPGSLLLAIFAPASYGPRPTAPRAPLRLYLVNC